MKKSVSLKSLRQLILSFTALLLVGAFGYWLGSHRFTLSDFNPFLKKKNGVIPQAEVVNKAAPAHRQNVDFSLFWEVWDRLEKNYLEKKDLDPEKMVYGAIQGMTAALGDPYTVFLPPSENQASKEDLNGSFEGVGIQLGYKDGNQLVVMAPLAGMPAEKAGIKAGDLILHIKDTEKKIDRDTLGISLPEAVKLIRGKKGTEVTLTLLREKATKPYEVTLVRETIIVPSVSVSFGYLDEDGQWQEIKDAGAGEKKVVAWLKLLRFGELTLEQWDKAIGLIEQQAKNKNQKFTGVILDLRNNPGGYLEGAVNLASEFLPSGRLVVKQENADGSFEEYKVKRLGRLLEIPLVVLVNKGSASASEILAGALRDWGRAKIVGEKTFGKGTVQEALDLREGAGLHVTVAKWLLPKGDWIHEEGLKPDVEINTEEKEASADAQLQKAIEVLLKT
jgi:carboxyl-terminal processing protease